MTRLEADELPADLRSMVADIYFQGKKNGYLTLYFSPNAQASLMSQMLAEPVMIWVISGFSWGLLLFVISFKQIRSRWKMRPAKDESSSNGKDSPSQNQLLRQLLKHSNGKKHNSDSRVNLLVIKANWQRLNEHNVHQLLKVFNRWLPKNGIYFLSFKQSLLILGKDSDSIEPNLITQLQVLVNAMQQLKLEPTILVHNLEFEREVYQTFFEIIEPGIWLESDMQQAVLVESDNKIALEIESVGEVKLTQLPEIEASQRSGIERQARFLVGE